MKNSGIEWIGEIPDSWSIVLLSSLFKEHKEKNVGMKCNNLLSLSYGEIKRKNIDAVDGLLPKSFEGYNVIDNGDIVLRLTDLQNDQRSLRTGLCHERGIVTSAYVTLRKRNPELNSEFLHYYLHSFDVRKGFYGMGSGVRQGLNFDGIRKLEILLPHTQVQERIVSFLKGKLSQVDELIANQQGQIEKLKEYKQSVITEAVTKGLDKSAPLKDSGIEWIGEIPAHWDLDRIKFCATYNDEALKEKEDPELIIKYVDIGSVSLSDGITFIEEFSYQDAPSRARRITRKGDIIVSTVRTYLKAIAPIGEDGLIVSTGFCVLRPNEKISSKYMEYYCKSDCFTNNVSRNSYGISYPAINASALVSFHITRPLDEEQKQIADYLDKKCGKIDRLIAIKQEKIEKLQEYKRSLIYEYVTGKKEVV